MSRHVRGRLEQSIILSPYAVEGTLRNAWRTNLNPNEGWVYICRSPASPQLVKIGYTTNSPDARARELSRSTGVPAPFVVEYAEHVVSPTRVELIIHQLLDRYRHNPDREFFQVSVPRAIAAVAEACEPFRTEQGRQYASQWWAHHLDLRSQIQKGWHEYVESTGEFRLYVCQRCGARYRIQKKKERRMVECSKCGDRQFV